MKGTISEGQKYGRRSEKKSPFSNDSLFDDEERIF